MSYDLITVIMEYVGSEDVIRKA